jgi:hypothetical protein
MLTISLLSNYVSKVYNFGYTGAVQTFTVPCTGTYRLECWGANGGGAPIELLVHLVDGAVMHLEKRNSKGRYIIYIRWWCWTVCWRPICWRRIQRWR